MCLQTLFLRFFEISLGLGYSATKACHSTSRAPCKMFLLCKEWIWLWALFFQNEIGIISPYARQCKVIKDHLIRKGWYPRPRLNQRSRANNEILVGSVEVFQGNERRFIILSTVRNGGNIGFLDNYQRFNVAITRAKELLIVIGNSKFLRKDENWKTLINYAQRNHSLIYRR